MIEIAGTPAGRLGGWEVEMMRVDVEFELYILDGVASTL